MIFFKYLPHLYQGADHAGRRVLNSGGGGGGGHTTSTVTQTSIPDWLRPQTEAVLGAGMQEYFQTEFNPETGGFDITGTKPYTPYSTDPRDYVAQFAPQQQRVFGEVAGMQTPGGFMAGQQMTGMAGMGGLETVGGAYGYGGQGAGYGGQGAMYGGQAAGMGGLYEQMATDPMSMQAYMSPYMQNVVEIQKQQAIEDAQRAQLGANLGAARQGTYGGARQTLAQAQREAGLNKTLGDIQAQGLQTAFDQAQKAQQFGVTTGLQGLQTGISGAQAGLAGAGMGLQGVQAAQAGYGLTGQMGAQAANIGAAQQQADIQRLGLQREIGGEQQAQQQRIIDQAIQNFALAEEMPFQRLAGYNALLRGYATPTTTTSQYAAAPSAASQIAGLGTTGLALAGLGKKEGGVIKFAEGGITDVDALESMAEDLSISQLQQSMENKSLPKYIGAPVLENKVNEAERMKMAQAMMGQQGQQPSIFEGLMAKADQVQGIDALPVGNMVGAAGGGIVAFEDGGAVRFQNQGLVDPKTFLNYQNVKKEIPASVMRQAQAIVAKNPGMTVGRALGILGYGTGVATAGGIGLAATDALMSTDKGGRTVTGETPGYDYSAEEMMSGITPGAAGPRTAQSGLEAAGELFGGVGSSIMNALRPTGYQTVLDEARIAQAQAGEGPDVERNSAAPAKAEARRQEMIEAQTAAAQKPPAAAGIAPPASTGQKMAPSGEMSVEDFKKRQEAFGISGDPDADLRKQIEDMAAGSKSEREQAKYMALLQAGLGMMGGTSPFAMQNIAAGAQKGLAQYAGDIKDIKAQERDVMKMRGELARADDARKRGDFKSYMDAEDKARKYQLDLAEQATRDRMAGIQEQYFAGRLSMDQAKNQIAQERLGILNKQLYQKAYKQYMDAGGESKLRTEFAERFGKNWLKDPEYVKAFNQQMEAEIRRLAMMSDLGVPSADDLLGD
jgi:hypothetical protein